MRVSLPVIEAIAANHSTRHAKEDHFAVFQTPQEFVSAQTALNVVPTHDGNSWVGHLTTQESRRRCVEGDLSSVPAADALMAKIENIIPVSAAWQTFDSVVGAVPNVPNYISGNPVSMRQRKRVRQDTAPLSVVVDLASSGGIDAKDLVTRGGVILALVRALAAMRPIEVWASAALENHKRELVVVMVRIESAPLDLARAAFMLTHPSVPRLLMYDYARAEPWRSPVMYPYGSYDGWNAYRRHGAEIVSRMTSASAENTLFIPPMLLRDDMVKDPVNWATKKIRQYGGATLAGE